MTGTTYRNFRGILDAANVRAHQFDNGTGWTQRHMAAWTAPKGTEAPIVSLIRSLADYADAHQSRFESSIGDDGFLGPEWLQILKSTRALLNGDCGRLDCGTLDHMLCEMAIAAGLRDDLGI